MPHCTLGVRVRVVVALYSTVAPKQTNRVNYEYTLKLRSNQGFFNACHVFWLLQHTSIVRNDNIAKLIMNEIIKITDRPLRPFLYVAFYDTYLTDNFFRLGDEIKYRFIQRLNIFSMSFCACIETHSSDILSVWDTRIKSLDGYNLTGQFSSFYFYI